MSKTLADKYKKLTSDLRNKVNSGKLDNLTASDCSLICFLGEQLVEHHCVRTVIKAVADYFALFGFKVVMDFDDVNYVIVEV